MHIMSQTDRAAGLTGHTAIKTPCRVQTTVNITLSGEQTINGVACMAGDRGLVKDQTDGTENGIWVVNTGAYTRASDFDGNLDIVRGTVVPVYGGTTNTYALYVVQNSSVTIGTTSIVFQTVGADNIALAALLADTTDSANGDALIGVKRTESGAVARTQH